MSFVLNVLRCVNAGYRTRAPADGSTDSASLTETSSKLCGKEMEGIIGFHEIGQIGIQDSTQFIGVSIF